MMDMNGSGALCPADGPGLAVPARTPGVGRCSTAMWSDQLSLGGPLRKEYSTVWRRGARGCSHIERWSPCLSSDCFASADATHLSTKPIGVLRAQRHRTSTAASPAYRLRSTSDQRIAKPVCPPYEQGRWLLPFELVDLFEQRRIRFQCRQSFKEQCQLAPLPQP